MKGIKITFILGAMLIGFNANSQASKEIIKEIVLFDGTKINVSKEVNTIHTASDRENNVDYVELNDGMVIDSYDIESLILNESLDINMLRNIGTGGGVLNLNGDGSGAGLHNRLTGDGSGAGFFDNRSTVFMARGDGSGG